MSAGYQKICFLTLIFSHRYTACLDPASQTLVLGLRSITDIRPVDKTTSVCNFGIEVSVMPFSEKVSLRLRDQTLVYPKRTSLLFDLYSDSDMEKTNLTRKQR